MKTKTLVFIIGAGILFLLFLLSFTQLPLLLNISAYQLSSFQTSIQSLFFLGVLFYGIVIIVNFWMKDKYEEWSETESSSIRIVESHLLLPKIREYARKHYNLNLGDCIKIQPLMPHKEAGSVPTSRFFLFENMEFCDVVGWSMWKVDFVRVVNIHLFKRYHLGVDSYSKYWTGEFRNEQHQSIADTTASKKTKDVEHVKESSDNSSATEEN
jgi:hypothetical protein